VAVMAALGDLPERTGGVDGGCHLAFHRSMRYRGQDRDNTEHSTGACKCNKPTHDFSFFSCCRASPVIFRRSVVMAMEQVEKMPQAC
jgi:hypothetical protein